METSILVAFWVLSISLVITPGADWAYAISAGMREGALVPAIAGMLLGYLMITFVVAAGIGALVASVPVVLTVLTVLGAAYLLWLGFNVLRNPSVPSAGDEEAAGTWKGVTHRKTDAGYRSVAVILQCAVPTGKPSSR